MFCVQSVFIFTQRIITVWQMNVMISLRQLLINDLWLAMFDCWMFLYIETATFAWFVNLWCHIVKKFNIVLSPGGNQLLREISCYVKWVATWNQLLREISCYMKSVATWNQLLRESHTMYSKLTSSNLSENINTLAIKKSMLKWGWTVTIIISRGICVLESILTPYAVHVHF